MIALLTTKSLAHWYQASSSSAVGNRISSVRYFVEQEVISSYASSSLTPILLTAGIKRSWIGPAATYHRNRLSSYSNNCRTFFQVAPPSASLALSGARIHKNVARLYARRILELAAASAAIQRIVLQQQQENQQQQQSGGRITRLQKQQERPADWNDWQGHREWSSELLDALGNGPMERLWAATRRVVSISCLVAPFVVLYPLSLVSERIEQVSWRYALWGIEQAGPTYIKLFQWATTRHDLFSPEFCRYFGTLQDKTTGHSWNETVRIIQDDLGLPSTSPVTAHHNPNSSVGDTVVVNRFLTLDTTPVGSGCIAQVYRGTLTEAVGQYEAGTEVAVKVQHPGIWHKVCVDFFILGYAAQLLEGLPLLNLKYLSLADSVRKFRDIMLPQLDLTLEAKNLERFNRDFGGDPTVTFPRPLSHLTSTRVLTETFVHGKPILQYVTAPEAERKELALLGLNTTLKMIFLHDFLHGDLHPGNILVSRDKSVPGNPLRLHLLDCGLVVEMGPEQHVNLVKILGSFTRRNGRLAGQLMVDTSSDCQASDMDVELFVKGIEHIVVDDENNNFLEKVGDYITDICFLACQRKVKLEASFINAALAVEIMEGIATKLYPDLKVTKIAMPLVVQAELMHSLPKFSLW